MPRLTVAVFGIRVGINDEQFRVTCSAKMAIPRMDVQRPKVSGERFVLLYG